MDVRVTIVVTKTIERTYYVKGVNSLDAAAKCAERCATKQFQPNAYLWREVPQRPNFKTDSFEIVNLD